MPESQRSSRGRRAIAQPHTQPPQDKRPHSKNKSPLACFPYGHNLNPASVPLAQPPTKPPGAVSGLVPLHQTAVEDLPSSLRAPRGERGSLRQQGLPLQVHKQNTRMHDASFSLFTRCSLNTQRALCELGRVVVVIARFLPSLASASLAKSLADCSIHDSPDPAEPRDLSCESTKIKHTGIMTLIKLSWWL